MDKRRLCSRSRNVALRELMEVEERISPQRVALESEALQEIPILLDLALGSRTVIQPEIIHYLGDIRMKAMWAWRRVWQQSDSEQRAAYEEMRSVEDSISFIYDEAADVMVGILASPDETTRSRGSAAYFLGSLEGKGRLKMGALKTVYSEVSEESIRLDIMESVANLGISPEAPDASCKLNIEWLMAEMNDASPAIRLGASFSLMARTCGKVRESAERVASESLDDGRKVLERAMWMYNLTISMAAKRRFPLA